MRHFIIFVAGTITLSAAASAPAVAQDPGRIFGAMTRMLTAPLRQGFGPRIRIHRPPMDLTQSSRRNAIARAAAPQRAVVREPQRASIAPAAVQAGIHTSWIGAVFWPRAADDLVGYAFFPNETGERFWAYGFNDITDGIFTTPSAQAYASARRVRDDRAQALPAAAGELCGNPDGTRASADRIEQIVQPDAAQRELLMQLRQALAKADDDIKAACPSVVPASQSARLDIVEERLRALHYATLTIRTPLEKFYGALTDEQRAKLNGATQTASPARICQTQASPTRDRSAFALDPRARPTAEQRAYQEAMQKHLTDMAKFVAAACPQDIPATPLARLDAEADRLTVLLYAAMAMRPALDQPAAAPAAQPRAEAPTPHPRPRPVQANATPNG
jgi:hypothetical protein